LTGLLVHSDHFWHNTQMKKAVILFDPHCPICQQIKNLLILMGFKKNIRFVSVYDQKVYQKYPELNFWECRKVVHLLSPTGSVFKGEGIITYLLDSSKGISRYAILYKNPLAKTFFKLSYIVLSDLRDKLSKECPTCQV